ncbi:MAG: hypothetical protein ROY82_08025 [Truepera sp.]|nr:hypothetical protein [Truepera sp.]
MIGRTREGPAAAVAERADHARILLSWRALPFPTPWDEVFSSVAEPRGLSVEIGFGDGRFTVASALAEPHMRFVGLEVSSGSLQRALRRVRRAGLSNVRLAKAGAHVAIRQLFAPGSVDRFVVNFPCPWPKERHAKHRLLTRGFFDLAASRLREGGELRLATDHPEYLRFALDEAAACGLFEVLRPQAPAAVFETKYALKWREQGKPLHYVVFSRNGAPAPALPPLERPAIMPHALLRGKLPSDVPFAKVVLPFGGGHVILHEAMRSLGGEDGPDRVLVRATVEEPDLKQQLLVLAHQRREDEVIVRIESFGDPLITPAARGCVHAVTEWLLGASQLEVTARNY